MSCAQNGLDRAMVTVCKCAAALTKSASKKKSENIESFVDFASES